MKKVKVPAGMTTFSHAGYPYQAKDGYAEVPEHAVVDLQSHGIFTPEEITKREDAAKAAEAAKGKK